MVKKVFCLVLSLVLTLALATTALAAESLDMLYVGVLEDGYLGVIAGTDHVAKADLKFTAKTENGDLTVSDPVVLRDEGTSWFVVLEYGYYGNSEALIRTQSRVMQNIADMIGDNDEGALIETQVAPSVAMEKGGNFRDTLKKKHAKKKNGAKELGSAVRTTLDYINSNYEKLKTNVVLIIVTACPNGQVTEATIQDIGVLLENNYFISTHIIVTAGGDVNTKDRPLGQKLIEKAGQTVNGTGYMTNQLNVDEADRAVRVIDEAERRKVFMLLQAKDKSVLGKKITLEQKTSNGKKLKVNWNVPDAMYELWDEGTKEPAPQEDGAKGTGQGGQDQKDGGTGSQGQKDDGKTPAEPTPVPSPTPKPGRILAGSSSGSTWRNTGINTSTQPDGMSTELLVGIIVGAVLLALLAALLIIRLRKGGKKTTTVNYGSASSAGSSGAANSGTTVTLAGANGAMLKGQIKNGKLTIGRNGAKAMISVPNDGKLSGLHATFTKQGNSLMITDNGSTNGTKVNGNKIAANTPTQLQQNDTVTMGSTTYTITWR